MAFIETPRFPECVALGALSKPRYKTTTIQTLSGYRTRNIEWAQPLHSYEFAKVMDQTAHDSLLAFFHAAKGMGHQFRVKDPADNSTTIADGLLLGLAGTGQVVVGGFVGSGYGSLLAAKAYTAGSETTYRWLQKLVDGTVQVRRAAALVVEGVAPGQIAINENTGNIVFVADQSRAIASHTVGALHTFNFGSAFSPNFGTGGRIYVSGAGGADAALVNGIAHEVTSAGGLLVTVNLNTTGKVITGGTAFYFPQPSESLTIVCDFDVPCLFSSDEASFDLIQKTPAGEFFYQWTGINLEEDRIKLP